MERDGIWMSIQSQLRQEKNFCTPCINQPFYVDCPKNEDVILDRATYYLELISIPKESMSHHLLTLSVATMSIGSEGRIWVAHHSIH